MVIRYDSMSRDIRKTLLKTICFGKKSYIDLSVGSVTLIPECVEALSDLELHCPHMTRDKM